MSEYITVKYFAESEFAKKPYQATEDTAGCELFTAETKTLLPNSVHTIALDLRWVIPTGFYDNVFPRSGIFKEHLVTVDVGVIDSDFRSVIQVLLINHHREKTFTVRVEDRIAQVLFMKTFNVDFQNVSDPAMLGKAKRSHDGFGSTGVQVIKKVKQIQAENEMIISPEKEVIANADVNLRTTSEKIEDELHF